MGNRSWGLASTRRGVQAQEEGRKLARALHRCLCGNTHTHSRRARAAMRPKRAAAVRRVSRMASIAGPLLP